MNNLELTTTHKNIMYFPVVEDGVEWSTERQGTPGKLTFSAMASPGFVCEEGDHVCVNMGKTPVFYGFVFSKKRDKDGLIQYTCYDQLRYLKNKDTYSYEDKTAAELLKMIAEDFYLQTGTIEDTAYTIAYRTERDTSLFDMLKNALDLTLENKNKLYVLYDDYGKLCLRDMESMKLDLLIDGETGENYDYASSIDQETYNQVKLLRENEESGTREIYLVKDSEKINRWGVLQYFEAIDEQTNGQQKAEAMLSLYGKPVRTLSISGALGDLRVRAGTSVIVMLDVGDVKLQHYMLVESAKHTFYTGEHRMDLTLRGGALDV